MKKLSIGLSLFILAFFTMVVFAAAPTWDKVCLDPNVVVQSPYSRPNGQTGTLVRCVVVGTTPTPSSTPTPQPTSTPSPTNTPVPGCDPWPNAVPAGSLPSQAPPVFCLINNSGPDTAQAGQNSWYDDFDHGLSFADLIGTQYQEFNEIGAWRTIYWRHANHWMVDMAPHSENETYGWNRGISMLRPNQTFHFENGKFIVETAVAAGHSAYGDAAWPEIVISTGPAPYYAPIDLYAYDQFPEFWTLGCRLQASRVPICALRANNATPPATSQRIWEMSFWQQVGDTNFGGGPFGDLANYWRVCAITDPDTNCLDTFRLELTATSLTLYVNGSKYFEQTGIPSLPDELLTGDLYVYLASSHVSHQADTIRYHWDSFKVN